MWKIDADGNASNELGEKMWLDESNGFLIIRYKEFVATKKFRGFMNNYVATFYKGFPVEDAREFLYRHVDRLNLKAELPYFAVKEIEREVKARAKARQKSKMLSLWAQ